jgi:sugar phosphate permease
LALQAWFVDDNNRQRKLTPNFILVLFIVSVLACAWAIATLFRLSSTRRSAHFVTFVDLCFVGAFIAAVYELRGIANADCANFNSGDIYVNLGLFGYYGRQSSDGGQLSVNVKKDCAMLKASWAFGIMNTIFFFITAILAFLLRSHERESRERVVRRSHHGSRRGHSGSSHRRHSSSSRRYYV